MIAVISLFSHKLGFESGLSIALFPMVIPDHDHRTPVDHLGRAAAAAMR